MVFYVVLFAAYLVLVGLWLWAVARWTGMRFPVPDIVITTAVCSVPALFGTVGFRLIYGWLLGLIILSLILTRVEDADLWPELTLMVGGTLLIWFVGYGVVLALAS
jgi:hypothetical protein